MRIISPFKDYYDSVGRYSSGGDTSIVLQRFTSTFKADDKSLPTGFYNHVLKLAPLMDRFGTIAPPNRYFSELNLTVTLVVFCGKVYPLFHFSRSSKETNITETRLCYNVVEIQNLLAEHGVDLYAPRGTDFLPRRYSYRSHRHFMITDVLQKAKTIDLTGYVTEHNIPSFHLHFEETRYGSIEVDFHPNLSKLNFQKAVDPWQAYQELSMLIGNIVMPEKVEIKTADKYKVLAHGFDEQYGFRKRPTSS